MDKRIDPKQQFSKKLARWTAVFWFVFMAWLSAILIIEPNAAQYAVYMGLIATAVMVLNVWAYTRNSIYEKGVLALLDKTRMELILGNKAQEDEEDEDEGGDNDG